MKRALLIGATAVLAASAAAVFGQDALSALRGPDPDLLLDRAQLQEADARAIALRSVPGGRIIESELEEENGRLIYSFEVEGQDGVQDVEIDAITGEVLGIEHEDDEDDDDDGEDDDRNGDRD